MALTSKEKVELLGSVELFSSLSPRELEALAQVSRTRTVKKRAELFHKGDEGSQVYVVVSGQLKILTTAEDGDDVVFTILGRGELIGEIALLTGTERTATVQAVESSDLLVIDRREFFDCLRRFPEVSIKLLQELAKRVKRLSEFVEEVQFLKLPERLAKRFLEYAGRFEEEIQDGIKIAIKLNQEEWGDLVGATRESVNKQIKQWTARGLIRVEKGYVVILSVDRLRELADPDGLDVPS